MSLFGNYIADMKPVTESAPEVDAADAFYEAAMKTNTSAFDYEYYGNILESSVSEFISFESAFIDEFAFVNEAASKEKFGKFKEIVNKFISMITGLIEKIKSAFTKIKEKIAEIKNKKFAQKNTEAIKLIEDKGGAEAAPAIEDKGEEKEEEKKPGKDIGIKHKAGGSSFKAELSKKLSSFKLYQFTPEFVSLAKKLDGPKRLKLNFGYGKNSALRTSGGQAASGNNAYLSQFAPLQKGIEGCTTLVGGGSALELEKKFEAINNEMVGLSSTCEKVLGYLAETKALAKHVEDISVKQYEKAMNAPQTDDEFNNAAVNYQDMYADFAILQKYAGYLTKAAFIFNNVYFHNTREYTKFTGLLELYKRKIQAAA